MKRLRLLSITLILLMFTVQIAAAGVPSVKEPAAPVVQKIRFSQTAEQVRIVFDMSSLPEYKVSLQEEPHRLVVDMTKAVNKSGLPEVILNDKFVDGLHLSEAEPGKLRAVLDLKTAVSYKVFTLPSPNRLVIDIIKIYEKKTEQQVMPGLNYTSWLRGRPAGPVQAHILSIDLKQGFVVKPVLSNGTVAGLETVSGMARSANAVAAVDGAYFGLNGEILGLMKLDGELISTPTIPRTAMGVMPDNKIILDQVAYQGTVELPDGQKLEIDGLNRERGVDELVVYNSYYGPSTKTNIYGIEYVVTNGQVEAVKTNDSVIPAGSIILSAHGQKAKSLAVLKPGDKVNISQSIGPVWDKTLHALGAGPMLVKNNSIFLTTKIEEFGSDVSGGRAPRTALGLTKDGKVLLVVVDGRQTTSIGMTLLELALFMQELGAVDAMNFDGGGSSEMVINDKIINKPSDGRERQVGSGLAVISTRLAI